MSDADGVRNYFGGLIAGRKGALISCDPIPVSTGPMVRVVSKYRAGRVQAMTYVASLAVPFNKLLVELLISGSEDNFTGVREALITHELMQTAGASEQEQLKRNVIPIEWKFERYHPGTRGELAYLLSDDEKYDTAFPHHPLTRVRRWLRHIERTFRVVPVEEPPPQPAAKHGLFGKLRGGFGAQSPATFNLKSEPAPAANRFEIELVAPKPMSYEEIVRELGPRWRPMP